MFKVRMPESNHAVAALEGVTPSFGLILAAIVALFVALSIYLQTPPASLRENAPPDSFSAERALKHLRIIARSPHPMGTVEHDAVRDYIYGELNSMGLRTETQRTTVVARQGNPQRVGTVENVIGRLAGTGNSQAILLVAHYDSVPNSPGASDDGAGVAALLETARALKSGAPLKNDVIFLFTDGEEVGLLGAKAFVDEHLAAKDVGVVLNFEARGSSGPSIMFETSDQNGWLVREFARAAPDKLANSLSYEIYKRLPNDTDLTIFKQAGFHGLNFAYIDGLNRYHTAADSVENIDARSLQDQGSSALAVARHFASIETERRDTSNAVYFNLLGRTLVNYPQWLVVPLAVLTLLLFAGVVVLGFRRGMLRTGRIAFGFAALMLCGLASSAVMYATWRVITALHRDYEAVPWGAVY